MPTNEKAVTGLDAVVLLYAARYALGRRSGAAQDMEHAISANLAVFRDDSGCREALIRDIEESRDKEMLGMPVDASCWMRTLGRLEACRG